jgi:hypothetical protein
MKIYTRSWAYFESNYLNNNVREKCFGETLQGKIKPRISWSTHFLRKFNSFRDKQKGCYGYISELHIQQSSMASWTQSELKEGEKNNKNNKTNNKKAKKNRSSFR